MRLLPVLTLLWLLLAAPAVLVADDTPEAQPGDEHFTDPDLLLDFAAAPPNAFPEFVVPGHEAAMDSLRRHFYLHYLWRPYATMWDTWIPRCIIWADTGADPRWRRYTSGIRDTLATRHMDIEGYVSTMQHRGMGHPHGWPFPLWNQGPGAGWQFSIEDYAYREWIGISAAKDTAGWTLTGATDQGLDEKRGWTFAVDSDRAVLTTPAFKTPAAVAPYIRLEWWHENLGPDTRCYLEWTTTAAPEFGPERRMAFAPEYDATGQVWTAVPIYRMLADDDTLTGARVIFENARDATITVQALFTAVDTRHQINNFAYIQGCCDYLDWTGDINFLRRQLNRMRFALAYALDEFQVEKHHCVFVPWPNHDGRSGLEIAPDGRKTIHYGRGVGGNYYDLLPFGGYDAYATSYCHDVLQRMARLEQTVAAHPEWNLPSSPVRRTARDLRQLAEKVRVEAGRRFWNPQTKRFIAAEDIDGRRYDYGIVFVNLEAVYYGLAQPAQARDIYDWLSGERIVEGDTSQGDDIYRWRFAPRATTRRNLEYYVYAWNQPETIEWGGQVQDGGAVLAWSYFDIMNRIELLGPDNAWTRLREIIAWFDDVRSEGGYRAYYGKPGRGTLQGGNVAGGLGMDQEFVESILLPQTMVFGFLGLQPGLDRLAIAPRLPGEWPELTITQIRWHGDLLDITAARDRIRIDVRQGSDDPRSVVLPAGRYRLQRYDADGAPQGDARMVEFGDHAPVTVPFATGAIEFVRP